MKKIISIVVVVGVVALFAGQKIVGKANENLAVESTKETEDVVLQEEVVHSATEEETFTYRLYVDKLDMYSYNKGHNGTYTIEYSVNGSEVYVVDMKLDVVGYLGKQPLYVAHYVDVENVKEGDVIEYKFSYYNTYLFPNDVEPSVKAGSKVVSKDEK